MEQEMKQHAIMNLITKIAAKIDGITSEQIELIKEFYIDDERNLKEIESEIKAYFSSIEVFNTTMTMSKQEPQETYLLDVNSPIKGIYLSPIQIDLMTITEIESTNELLAFIKDCAQIEYNEFQLEEFYKMKLDLAKRKVFEDYRKTLIGTADLKYDPNITLKRKISSLGLNEEVAEEAINLYKEGKVEEAINYITTKLNLDYGTIISENFRKHRVDTEDIKCSSYEEVSALAQRISDFDIITITAGQYKFVMNNGTFDSYHIKRGLDFCKKHDVQARYNSLITQELMESFLGKQKDEIIEQMRMYISQTIEFINQYNKDNSLSDGMPVINSINIFSELVNLKKDKSSNKGYYNIWQQLGLDESDLIDVLAPAIGNKPLEVDYIYNEAFVETKEKRDVQFDLAKRIHQQVPELIDIFGTEMHITTDFKLSTIEDTFKDLKKFSDETGIEIAITEFDMHLPVRELENLQKVGKSSIEIAEYAMYRKLTQISKIASIAKKTGISFSDVSYCSVTDSMDYNKKRQNVTTVYGGLFGNSLEPKGINEIVEYKPPLEIPQSTVNVLGYLDTLNSILETQQIIAPQENIQKNNEQPKQFVKKSPTTPLENNNSNDAGYANFPQILMLTLFIIAILYILLM